LVNAGGAVRVSSPTALSEIIRELLLNSKQRDVMGQKAIAVFANHQGAVARTLAIMQMDHPYPLIRQPHMHILAGLGQ
jgi:3-deoxy-D-manno-octulosonic-acid transferase